MTTPHYTVKRIKSASWPLAVTWLEGGEVHGIRVRHRSRLLHARVFRREKRSSDGEPRRGNACARSWRPGLKNTTNSTPRWGRTWLGKETILRGSNTMLPPRYLDLKSALAFFRSRQRTTEVSMFYTHCTYDTCTSVRIGIYLHVVCISVLLSERAYTLVQRVEINKLEVFTKFP